MTSAPLETAHPSRSRAAAVLLVLALVTQLLVAGTASASPSDESAFIDGVNQARAEVGLAPLQFDVQLTELARGWSQQMQSGTCGEGSFICHASPISAGVTHSWAKLGENVGTGPDVQSVMAAFIASPGHYANIIDPEFTHIGVGVVWDGPRLYTTHRFMKLQGSDPAPTPTTTTTAAPPTTTTAPVPEPLPPPAPVPPPTDRARADVVVQAIAKLERA